MKKVAEKPFIPAACATMESLSSRRHSTGQKQVFDKGISVYCFSCGEQTISIHFLAQNNHNDGSKAQNRVTLTPENPWYLY